MSKLDSTYTCLENKCFQTLSSLSSFKRHLNRKQVTFNTISQNSQNNDEFISNENNFNYDPQYLQNVKDHLYWYLYLY